MISNLALHVQIELATLAKPQGSPRRRQQLTLLAPVLIDTTHGALGIAASSSTADYWAGLFCIWCSLAGEAAVVRRTLKARLHKAFTPKIPPFLRRKLTNDHF